MRCGKCVSLKVKVKEKNACQTNYSDTNTHTYTYTYIYTHTYIYVYTYKHTHIHTHTYTRTHTNTHTHRLTYIHKKIKRTHIIAQKTISLNICSLWFCLQFNHPSSVQMYNYLIYLTTFGK